MWQKLCGTALAAALMATVQSAAIAENDPAGAKKTVAKGGEFWSSPAEFAVGETTIAPGQRLLFWPAEEGPYDATRKRVPVRFQWRLMSGEKQFKKGQSLQLTIFSPADPDFRAAAIVQMTPGADEGTLSAMLPLEKCDCTGDADLVMFLGLKEPHSNLLQMKMRFERVAKLPATQPMR
jgi:hypothetical protein